MAVYTQLTNEHIAELLDHSYGLGPLSFAVGIAQGVENTNYLVAIGAEKGQETKYVLTLYEKRVNIQDLPFFLELMQHVAQQGVACPAPIKRQDGTLYGMVKHKQAALVSFLNGKSRTVLNEMHVASVGNTLGAFHVTTAGFSRTRANALSLAGWQALYQKIAGKLDAIEPGLESIVRDELDYLSSAMANLKVLPQGVIHADLFPDNVFFEGDALSGIIDFYFACNDALAYDVAITLNAWCFEPDHRYNAAKAKLLLQEYQKKRAFTAMEIAAFPVLLRGAALRFLLTRLHDWIYRDAGALVTPHDPLEYAAKLRFHRNIRNENNYGF